MQNKKEKAVEIRRLATLIGAAGRQWRRAVDQRLQDYDLTEAAWMPLVLLDRSTDPMRQIDIAAALSLDKSSVVRVLSNLETAGLIERQTSETDRRANAIVITKTGRALIRKLERISEQLEQELLEGLSKSDVAAARRVLEHICRTVAHAQGRE